MPNQTITSVFAEIERQRVVMEAKHCVEFYNITERREYLESVQKWRGEVGRKCMEKAIIQEWESRKK
jgi:hypothetical protein